MYGNRGMGGSTGYENIYSPTGETQSHIPRGYKSGSLRQFTPEQMKLFGQSFGSVGPDSYLSRLAGGDESLFNEMEAPALRQFGALQGNIASRFSGMGSGARKSSGFQNTINSASSDFAQQLQSKRQDLMRQARMDLHGMTQDLLNQRPYEQFVVPKSKPWWQEFLTSIGGGAGQALGSYGVNRFLPRGE